MAGRKKKPRIATGRKREASLSETSLCSENLYDILPEQEAGEIVMFESKTIQSEISVKRRKFHLLW